MDLHEFFEVVKGRSDGLDVEPKRAVKAVLHALADRLERREAKQLQDVLPDGVSRLLDGAEGMHPFDRDDFIEDVAGRLDVNDDEAEQATAAVLGAVMAAISRRDAVEQVVQEMPSDLVQLLHSTE